MKIALIQSTGNSRSDLIFTGAFGQLQDGVFHIADELKGIHLFTLVTPETLKAQGIDLANNVAELDVPDDLVGAVKSSLLLGLREHWLSVYSQQQLPPGFAKAALDAEARSVKSAIETQIQAIGLPAATVLMDRPFSSAHVHAQYAESVDDADDDYGSEASGEVTGVFVQARTLASQQFSNATAWQPAAADGVDFGSLPEMATSTTVVDFASGVVRVALNVRAAPEQENAVAAFLMSLPPEVFARLDCLKDARIAQCEFHPDNRQAHVAIENDAAGQPEGPATDAPGAAA